MHTQPESVVLLAVPDLTIAVSGAGLEVCQSRSSFILRYPIEWLSQFADDIRVALVAEIPPIYHSTYLCGKTCLMRITTAVFEFSFYELEGLVRFSMTLKHAELWQLLSKFSLEVAKGSLIGMIALPDDTPEARDSPGVQIPLPLLG